MNSKIVVVMIVIFAVVGGGLFVSRGLQKAKDLTETKGDDMKLKAAVLTATLIASTQVWAGDATVTGKISLDPTVPVPTMTTIKMSADPKCEANNAGKEIKAQSLVMSPDKTVANVFVRVKSGLKTTTFTTPTEPVVVDQFGCMYIPHVIATMVNQPVKIKNSDGTLHNVHGTPTTNAEFNIAMPAFKKEMDKVFDKEESPFHVKCDVHPWMSGYVAVMTHPYFSVTKEDGKFEIKGLDAGEYEIEVWHEKLGVQTAKVTVAAGETKVQDFVLTKPTTVGQLEAIIIER